jgi:cell division septum initiation protein DivIVA
MTNPADTAREQFEIVRRGYEPQQVDRRLASLFRDLQATRQRAAELERRVEELRNQALEPSPDHEQAPPFAGLGARIEEMLGLADEEARDLRGRAAEDADQHRLLAEQAADKIRGEAGRYAEERRNEADMEAARVLEDARRQTDQLRDDTERNAKSRREEAEALFERNRAKAAQAAADFETTLAHRRDQAEHDFTEAMKANENQLGVVSQRAEQLRLEAEKLRADADRKSTRTLDEAQRRAADVVAEAKASAERIRTESERELSAAIQRRDSINAQLTNVRRMLATLTGASLPNPFADDGPETEASSAAKPDAPDAPDAPRAPKATGESTDAATITIPLPPSNVTPTQPGGAKPTAGKPGPPSSDPSTATQQATVDANSEARAGATKGSSSH